MGDDKLIALSLALVLVLVGGCTETPDIVAIAVSQSEADAGETDPTRSGGAELPDGATDLFARSGLEEGECDYVQALMDARIPVETLFVALTCEVPLGAVQPTAGEAPPQELVSRLLNTSDRIDDEPDSAADETCDDEPGRWFVEDETVHLCPALCELVGDVVSDLVQQSCDAADGDEEARRPGFPGGEQSNPFQ